MSVFRISDFIYKNRVLIYILFASAVLLSVNITSDKSIPFFLLIWMLIGNFIISKSFIKDSVKDSRSIFNITFCIYIIFIILAYLFYIDNPLTTYFYAPDQMTFYNRIVIISQYKIYNGPGLLDIRNQDVLTRGTGIYYIGWIIGRISYALGGNNSLIIHQVVVAWCASMINVFTYKICRYFFNEKVSKDSALLYGLLSFNFIYSLVLLRDVQTALPIVIGFYIILGDFKIKRLIMLVLLAMIAFTFRPTHGVFCMLLIANYIYTPLKKYKLLTVIFSLIMFFIIISFFITSDLGESLTERSELYVEYHDTKIEEAQGGSYELYSKLPDVMHPIVKVIQSQLNPFVLLGVYVVPTGINQGQKQYLSYLRSISFFLWFIIWIIIIYGLFNKRIRKNTPYKIWHIFSLALLLLILGGFSSPEVRRLLGVYPIIYITGIFILSELTKNKREIIVNTSVIFYLISGVLLHTIF